MKVILVDDEVDAIETLSIMLTEFIKDIEIVGTANSAIEAIKLINAKNPDLVFLDVEMPHASGFDVLEGVANRNFQVIFITAYDHYAIKAIKANAIDYLMKPVHIDELSHSIEKARNQLQQTSAVVNDNLLITLKKEKLTRIPISVRNNYILVDLEDIQYVKSSGAYSEVNTFDQSHLTSKNLGYFEELLTDYGFLRVNNSHLINIEKVTQFLREDGGVIVLKNGTKITVSRNKKAKLKHLLNL